MNSIPQSSAMRARRRQSGQVRSSPAPALPRRPAEAIRAEQAELQPVAAVQGRRCGLGPASGSLAEVSHQTRRGAISARNGHAAKAGDAVAEAGMVWSPSCHAHAFARSAGRRPPGGCAQEPNTTGRRPRQMEASHVNMRAGRCGGIGPWARPNPAVLAGASASARHAAVGCR